MKKKIHAALLAVLMVMTVFTGSVLADSASENPSRSPVSHAWSVDVSEGSATSFVSLYEGDSVTFNFFAVKKGSGVTGSCDTVNEDGTTTEESLCEDSEITLIDDVYHANVTFNATNAGTYTVSYAFVMTAGKKGLPSWTGSASVTIQVLAVNQDAQCGNIDADGSVRGAGKGYLMCQQ